MARRTKADPTAWRDSPAGNASYEAARAEAQKKANRTGFDHGIEPNDLFKEWHTFMLPRRENRYGHEASCEVVMCENLDRCQAGHGPMASGWRRSPTAAK